MRGIRRDPRVQAAGAKAQDRRPRAVRRRRAARERSPRAADRGCGGRRPGGDGGSPPRQHTAAAQHMTLQRAEDQQIDDHQQLPETEDDRDGDDRRQDLPQQRLAQRPAAGPWGLQRVEAGLQAGELVAAAGAASAPAISRTSWMTNSTETFVSCQSRVSSSWVMASRAANGSSAAAGCPGRVRRAGACRRTARAPVCRARPAAVRDPAAPRPGPAARARGTPRSLSASSMLPPADSQRNRRVPGTSAPVGRPAGGDLTAGRPVQSGEQAEQRGLAAAAGSQEGDEFARRAIQADVVQDPGRAARGDRCEPTSRRGRAARRTRPRSPRRPG